ncbi:DNA-binding MarR family transcriptional regulator [Actinoplanes tereljensis]|uniref:MarR family transcriptional regulator n=1 Tax=Paractinoplanes tereljensis TaxID=571912 RepID=A0A919TP91_9ACTN|nr:MarR family transcriptional regulator [Actinoplanes tereljensis]GIF17718.1 MarR family transcriptional regulator [Actinoplanes tereljensis]
MVRPITQIGLAVKRLQHRHHRASDAALAGLGISLVQWDALRHIAENPGASLHDLAQLTFQSDQGFGTLANRMVERGLIERIAGPGRAVRHQVTERGDQLRAEAQTVLEGMLTESFAALSPAELATFDRLLQKLVQKP